MCVVLILNFSVDKLCSINEIKIELFFKKLFFEFGIRLPFQRSEKKKSVSFEPRAGQVSQRQEKLKSQSNI